jgi:hypothetical protein
MKASHNGDDDAYYLSTNVAEEDDYEMLEINSENSKAGELETEELSELSEVDLPVDSE